MDPTHIAPESTHVGTRAPPVKHWTWEGGILGEPVGQIAETIYTDSLRHTHGTLLCTYWTHAHEDAEHERSACSQRV